MFLYLRALCSVDGSMLVLWMESVIFFVGLVVSRLPPCAPVFAVVVSGSEADDERGSSVVVV